MMKAAGIYMIYNVANDKRYIGSSTYIKNRLSSHFTTLKKGIHFNKYLQRAWNKYGGDSFRFFILEYCKPEEVLQKEQYWLDNTQPEYNMLKEASSIMGYKFTKAQIEKMSLIKKAAWNRKSPEEKKKIKLFLKSIHPALNGVVRSEEYKEKISQNMKRPEFRNKLWEIKQQKIAEGTFSYKKVPVVQYDLQGNVVREWNSIKEAATNFGLKNSSPIINNCKGKYKSSCGFVWAYKTIEKCL